MGVDSELDRGVEFSRIDLCRGIHRCQVGGQSLPDNSMPSISYNASHESTWMEAKATDSRQTKGFTTMILKGL